VQEETTLRDLFEMLWYGKKILIIFTVAMMVISGLVSLFLLKPTYEAQALISIADDKENNLNSFVETARSDEALHKTINALNLQKNGYTIEELKKNSSIKLINGSRSIEILIKGQDANQIAEISNFLASYVAARAEISERSSKIVDARSKLLEVEDQITVVKNEFDLANKMLADTPQKLVTNKSLASDSYLQSVVRDNSRQSNKEIGALQLSDEQINPVYIALTQKISNDQLQISTLSAQKENLNNTIQTNNDMIEKLNDLTNNENLITQTLELQFSGFKAAIISPALKPNDPISPRVLLNVLISGVIGLMLSIIFLITRNYLKNTAINTESQSIIK
jgi:capsular polysaccharide biosynthesis protein